MRVHAVADMIFHGVAFSRSFLSSSSSVCAEHTCTLPIMGHACCQANRPMQNPAPQDVFSCSSMAHVCWQERLALAHLVLAVFFAPVVCCRIVCSSSGGVLHPAHMYPPLSNAGLMYRTCSAINAGLSRCCVLSESVTAVAVLL